VYSRQRFIVETLLKNKKEKAVRHCAVPSICLATKEQQQQQKEANGLEMKSFLLCCQTWLLFPSMFGVEKRVRREDGNKPNKKETE
jgi:hypothetical protein